jgi:hypothetical protein
MKCRRERERNEGTKLWCVISQELKSVPQLRREMVLLQVVSSDWYHYRTPLHFVVKLVPGLPTNNYKLPSRQGLPLCPKPNSACGGWCNKEPNHLSLSVSNKCHIMHPNLSQYSIFVFICVSITNVGNNIKFSYCFQIYIFNKFKINNITWFPC